MRGSPDPAQREPDGELPARRPDHSPDPHVLATWVKQMVSYEAVPKVFPVLIRNAKRRGKERGGCLR